MPPGSEPAPDRSPGDVTARQAAPEQAPTPESTSPHLPAERRTSPVELLWDLVFVFAVTQVTTLLRHHLDWGGFARSMLVLALVWWAWSAYVWVTNAHDPDMPGVRAALLLAAGLIFVAGLALPRAFEQDGPPFAIAYALVRFGHLGLYVDISRRGDASAAAIAGFAVTVAIGMALLVAGAYLHDGWRVAAWTAAAAIDYAGPALLTRERLRGLQRVAVEHFAERYGLFVIICLGESIVAIGFGAQGRPLDASLVVGVGLTLLITVELWWTYFARFAAVAQERLRTIEDPVLAASDGYSYLHLLPVAGIIVFAVGAREAVSQIDGPLAAGARLALCGGVALYLLGCVAFRLRMTGTVGYAKLAAALSCLLAFALTSAAAAWVLAASLAALLALMLSVEHVQEPAPV